MKANEKESRTERERFIDRMLKEILGGQRNPGDRLPTESELAAQYDLTARETEIMGLIAQRKSRAEIEQELFLSQNTVKTHVKHIYAKLDVHSHQELIDLVERQG